MTHHSLQRKEYEFYNNFSVVSWNEFYKTEAKRSKKKHLGTNSTRQRQKEAKKKCPGTYSTRQRQKEAKRSTLERILQDRGKKKQKEASWNEFYKKGAKRSGQRRFLQDRSRKKEKEVSRDRCWSSSSVQCARSTVTDTESIEGEGKRVWQSFLRIFVAFGFLLR